MVNIPNLGPPRVDFSSLAAIPTAFGQGLSQAREQQFQQEQRDLNRQVTLASLGLKQQELANQSAASQALQGLYGGGQTGSQPLPGLGSLSPAANAISGIESGGRYDALGPVTKTGDRAYGKYQVMGANVPVWTEKYAGRRMTPEEFLADQKAQDAVFQGEFGRLAAKHGPEGAARAWFAGEGGMNDPNRKDILGTSVADYSRKFVAGGGAGQPAPVQMAQAPGAPVSDAPAPGSQPVQFQPPGDEGVYIKGVPTQRLLQIQMMPGLSAQQSQALKVELEAREKRRQEAQALNKPTDVQRNYELAKSQGYQGSFLDYQRELRAQTTIKNEGNIPPGYRAVRDAQGNVTQLEPIPGSPAQVDAEIAKEKQDRQRQMQTTYGNAVLNSLNDIDRLMGEARLPTTGAVGSRLAGVSGTAAHDISQSLQTIKANVSFERLSEMRQASPTGGALGAVSDKETALLQNSVAALEQSQTEAQFKTNLGRVRAIFERIVHGRSLTAPERKYGGPITDDVKKQLREEAKNAIAGGADRKAVLKRLSQEYGIPGEGL